MRGCERTGEDEVMHKTVGWGFGLLFRSVFGLFYLFVRIKRVYYAWELMKIFKSDTNVFGVRVLTFDLPL